MIDNEKSSLGPATALFDQAELATAWDPSNAENHLVALVYQFASDPRHWFHLLTGISQCLRYQPDEQLPRALPDIGRRMMPHFKQAIAICAEIAGLEQARLDAQQGLDQLHLGILMLDQDDNVVLQNRAAQQALADWGPLLRHDGALCWPGAVGAEGAEGRVVIPSQGAVSLAGRQVRCQTLSDDGLRLVSIQPASDVAEGHALQHLAFADEWRLTPTETRLARALMNGESNDEIAEAFGIALCTVRDHLAALYRKLGVNRKSACIQVLLASQLFGYDYATGLQPWQQKGLPQVRLFCLPDGRNMSYLVHGNPAHRVVVLCHNFMGSALELPPSAYGLLATLGLCVVVPERPGYGDSDLAPGASHTSWCEDLEALLAHLSVDTFSLIGHSMGCNYAMVACDYFGHRVAHFTMVSPMVGDEDLAAYPEHATLTMRTAQTCVRFAPFLLKPMMQLMLRSDVEDFYERKEDVFSPTPAGYAAPSQRLYHMLEKPYFVANLQRSVKQGVDAWAAELALNFRPWRAPVPKHLAIHIWHGGHDAQVPLALVEAMHRRLVDSVLEILPEEGHGFLMRHVERILRAHHAALAAAC